MNAATPTPRILLAAACGLLACEPPWYPWPEQECDDATCGTTDTTTSTTGDASAGLTTGTVAGVPTSTGDDGSSTDGSAGDSETSGTTGTPVEPPAITDVALTPNPILDNGLITVVVEAEHADGVRIDLDDGSHGDLVAARPGVFEGSIAAFTGLTNGPHVADLTPWRGDTEGIAVAAPYTIALPEPGSQAFWEAGDSLGDGVVRAMGVLPGGQVVELGQRWVNGASRCYLRRRDKGGGWKPADVQDILPGIACAPLDMKIGADGAIAVLASRTADDGTRWWLGELTSWGAVPTHRGLGSKDEIGMALALDPAGTIAVCGTVPTGDADAKDAAAWIFRPNLGGSAWAFDYQPPGGLPHTIRETTRDCAWAGKKLVLVGEANGKHKDADQFKFDRHFILEFDTETKNDDWRVAEANLALQSGATAIVVDPDGYYITAGYTCAEECEPAADLRVYDPADGLLWLAPLGALPTKAFGPHDLAWSPAGYAVVAVGGTVGNETAFTVRAFAPFTIDPLWTFSREDNQQFHMAFAVAVGPFGEVYAGGFGANGYPAVAYVAG